MPQCTNAAMAGRIQRIRGARYFSLRLRAGHMTANAMEYTNMPSAIMQLPVFNVK